MQRRLCKRPWLCCARQNSACSRVRSLPLRAWVWQMSEGAFLGAQAVGAPGAARRRQGCRPPGALAAARRAGRGPKGGAGRRAAVPGALRPAHATGRRARLGAAAAAEGCAEGERRGLWGQGCLEHPNPAPSCHPADQDPHACPLPSQATVFLGKPSSGVQLTVLPMSHIMRR